MNSFEEFPVVSLTPKKETGVISFLTKYPEYDGRGTTIVILDSGVDPGANGLQVTSDGKRKIIHRFDCSGAGDVSTTTVVQPSDGYITGLTGRKLKIPEDWKNPTNNYRIGKKHAYHLYPEKLEKEMRQKYQENNWDPVQQKILGQARAQMNTIETKGDSKEKEKLKKEDLEATIDVLKEVKKLPDFGPIYDCVLFHDGEMWRCCVDSTEDGDLKSCPLLGEYSLTGDYAPITTESYLNYTFNVHNQGDTLELVGLCSAHGTLVAAIAAAYFPDKTAENGIAPGAQIISLTIGDCRLGSMETGTGLVRAMIKIMELSETENIQVINMSYGEHAHFADTGRLAELMTEIVDKYGITWVVSAGNHGPALNTVGSPPDMTQEIFIGVGAYVSPDMMLAGYSMRQKLPAMIYTWSSRGPAMDGGMGVTVCAPGGAVCSLPHYTLTYSQLCNGTSMSAPHTAGAISLLISGLRNKGIPYSPYSIKRAIEASATFLKDIEVFGQGSGLLNVEKTFDHLVAHHEAKELAVRFKISCGTDNRKGIYRRNKLNFPTFTEQVSIEPYFLNSSKVPAEKKINFNLRLALTCDATYVSAPSHLDLSNMSRTIQIKVDTTGLKTGVHNTFVKAYDLANIEKGVLFKIPVTIIIPQMLEGPRYTLRSCDVLFEPGTIKRHYIHVPDKATWFQLNMTTKDAENAKLVVHVLQILPRKSCKTIDSYHTALVNSEKDASFAFRVEGGSTVEVVIAKTWNDFGNIRLDYMMKFRGIKPNQTKISMNAADGILGMELSTLRGDDISPSVILNYSTLTVRPSEAKISALTARDVIANTRQIYELVLVYNFSVSKAEITPNLALLSDLLYESEFESQLWMLYDSNKRLLGCGDAYPSKYTKKVEKGDYVIRVQVRHEKTEYLEKLTEVPILIQQKLSSPVGVDIYHNYSNALIGAKKAVTHTTEGPEVVPIFLAPVASDKLPKIAGQYLSGQITFVKDEFGKAVDIYNFKYYPVDGAAKKNGNGNGNGSNGNNGKSKLEQLNDQIRDLKIQMMLKMDQPTAEKIFEDLCAEESAKHCASLYINYLSVFDPLEPTSALPPFSGDSEDGITKEKLSKVVSICDRLIKLIDSNALLISAAVKTEVKGETIKNKRLETNKNALIDALCHKGIAICRLELKNLEDSKTFEDLPEVFKSLGRFVDLADMSLKSLPSTTSVWYFLIWYYFTYKAYGKCFKLLFKYQEEQKDKKIEEKLIELSVLNGWTHVEQFLKRTLPSKFSETYEPF